MADVTKAEGILLRLKDCVANKQPVEDLSDEFYDVIQHCHGQKITIDNMKIISQKSDLCQVYDLYLLYLCLSFVFKFFHVFFSQK